MDVHDAFHVSQLKKCLRVPKEKLPIEKLSVQDDLTYIEYPIKILDTLTRVMRSKVIKMCKVQWSHHREDEATWEREEELRIEFPTSFLVLGMKTEFFGISETVSGFFRSVSSVTIFFRIGIEIGAAFYLPFSSVTDFNQNLPNYSFRISGNYRTHPASPLVTGL